MVAVLQGWASDDDVAAIIVAAAFNGSDVRIEPHKKFSNCPSSISYLHETPILPGHELYQVVSVSFLVRWSNCLQVLLGAVAQHSDETGRGRAETIPFEESE